MAVYWSTVITYGSGLAVDAGASPETEDTPVSTLDRVVCTEDFEKRPAVPGLGGMRTHHPSIPASQLSEISTTIMWLVQHREFLLNILD